MAGTVKKLERTARLSFGELRAEAVLLDGSCHILLYGGQSPHIGCTVLAEPRPSLTGDGSASAPASVLNVCGHKDEAVCRLLAETVASRTGRVTVCTGGFHQDGITPEQIGEVGAAARTLAEELAEAIR